MPQRLDFAQWDFANVPIGRKKLGIPDPVSGGVYAGTGVSATNASVTLNTAGIAISVAAPGAGGAGTGFTTVVIAGSNVVGTLDTNGISMGIPAYLTTAQPVGAYLTTAQPPGAYLTTAMQSDASSAFAGTGATIAGGSLTVNTAGVNISLPAYLTTAQPPGAYLTTAQPPGAYLTTAALSQDSSKYAGTGATIAGGSMTVNTDGVNISLPAYLTTAQPPGAYLTTAAATNVTSDRAGTNTSVVTTSGTDLSFAVNTSGVTIAYPKWLTTAVGGGGAGTNTSVATTAGTDLTLGVDTSGVTIGYPKWITTYVNDLTSGRAGIGETVATVAGTDLAMTVDTNGVNIAYPKWITTYVNDLTSGRAGTGTTLATTDGTDLKVTFNTDGINISYPKWITTAAAGGGVAISNSETLFSSGTVAFSKAGGAITIASSAGGQSLMFSVPATSSLSALGGLGITTNGSTISMSAPSVATHSYWANFQRFDNASTTMAQSNSFYVFPITLNNNVSASYLRMLASFNFTSTTIASSAVNNATGASTAFSETVAWNALVYTMGAGANSRSLQNVYSTSAGLTWAASVSQESTTNASRHSITQAITFPNEGLTTNALTTQYSVTATNAPISTTQWSNLSAQRYLDIPFATSLSAGVYWLAVNRFSGTVGGKNMDCNASIYGASNSNLTFANMNSATNVTNAAPFIGFGVWTQAAAGTSASINIASISVTTSYAMPFVQMIRQA